MRTLLIGALSTTLIGCSCLAPQQVSLGECTSKNCFDKLAAAPEIEAKPAAIKPNTATTTRAKTARIATAKKPSLAARKAAKPVRPAKQTDPAVKDATPAAPAKSESSAPGEADVSDPVLKQAKTAIAAKMEDPASVEFSDMKRAIRKNTFGKSVDTICGHVKGKNAAGEDIVERPFLYLVKENDAYVVDGNADSAAASAYRNICN